jgi:hypothetical protein
MLRFFRRIRKRLLDDGHLPRYAAYAVGEILLVVVGILIALQINNLNEERKEAALAATYIENLKQDMISDLETLQSVLDALEFYEDEGFYSLNVIDETVVEIDKVKFLKSLILRQNELLRDGIARALSLRVWQRKELLDMRDQIQTILTMLGAQE